MSGSEGMTQCCRSGRSTNSVSSAVHLFNAKGAVSFLAWASSQETKIAVQSSAESAFQWGRYLELAAVNRAFSGGGVLCFTNPRALQRFTLLLQRILKHLL